MADREPRVLSDGEVIDVGGKRFRYIDTPHVPHGWDAGVIFEENTGTLLCGDLFTHVGNGPAITDSDIIEPSVSAERSLRFTSLGPATGGTVRKLAAVQPKVLATMHGSSFSGDGAAALTALGDFYDRQLRTELAGRELS
jgi:flavorubredoxin